jgi:hypothetical protein
MEATRKVVSGFFAFVALTALASRAGAVEHEHHVGVDAGGAVLVVNGKSSADVGGGFGLHYAYGLTDAFNLMAESSFSLVGFGDQSNGGMAPSTYPAWLGNADVGVCYVLDVLQFVPYGGLLAGGYALGGGTMASTRVLPGFELALGLDWRLGRAFAVGFAFRQHMVTDPGTYPSFTQFFGRFEYTWGW